MITPLRFIRMQRCLSHKDFARMMGVPFSTLRMYERGDRPAPLHVVRKAVEVFGVSPSFMIREFVSIDGDGSPEGHGK